MRYDNSSLHILFIFLYVFYILQSRGNFLLNLHIYCHQTRNSRKNGITYCHREETEISLGRGQLVVISRVNHMVMIFCSTLQCIAKTISRVIRKTEHATSKCNVNIIRN